MRCPFCGSYNNRILNTRQTKDGAVRRRRECYHCGKRFRTFEEVWTDENKLRMR